LRHPAAKAQRTAENTGMREEDVVARRIPGRKQTGAMMAVLLDETVLIK